MGIDSDDSGSNPTWIVMSVVGLLLAGLGGFIYYADQQRRALKGEQQQDGVRPTTNQPATRARQPASHSAARHSSYHRIVTVVGSLAASYCLRYSFSLSVAQSKKRVSKKKQAKEARANRAQFSSHHTALTHSLSHTQSRAPTLALG